MSKSASCQDLKFGVIYTEDRKNDILSRCMKNKFFLYGMLILGLLTAITLLLNIKLPLTQSFRIVFGLVFVIFLPGFVWSFVLFKNDTINLIERFTFSIVLSITIVPLIIFFFNKIGVKINTINCVLEILSITIAAILINYIKQINIFYKSYEKN